MSMNFKKLSKSLDDLRFFRTQMPPSKLLWSDWVDISFLKYLDLRDSECKKSPTFPIPWCHIPYDETAIIDFCIRSNYAMYKPIMMNKLASCDDKVLPHIVRELLHVTKLFNIVYDAEETTCLYYNIAYSLFDKGCDDPTLFLNVWNTLCVPSRAKVAVFSEVIGKHRMRKSAKLLKHIIETAHTVRFNFWGAWSKGHNLIDFNYCPVTAALLNGNLEQMKILLQYGFVPNSNRLCSYDKHFLFCAECVYSWLRRPILENISERKKAVAEVLLFLINTGSCSSRDKRLAMTQCFRLLWSVIPTPFVTRQELLSEVYLQFSNHSYCTRIATFPTTENHFLKLCDYYPDAFLDEDAEISQPRRLKHLCKCVIRTELQSSWNLPMGIKDLPLPKNIILYLQLEE